MDPGFWDEIAGYLQSSGSVGYEQDWLSEITRHSPGLTARVGMDDQFLGSMADAFARRGMSLQYCMAYPMHFLQGSKYANLTTIRTSMDGFKPEHYRAFLYASRLAAALGIWPWTDVFRSADTDSLLLATLSAGPVGTGDFLGQEDKAGILLAARPDGVLVKPDASLLPTDQSYLAEAQGRERPLVASTFTRHQGLETVYAVAIRKPGDPAAGLAVEPGELGLAGPAYVFDYFSGSGKALKAGTPWTSRSRAGTWRSWRRRPSAGAASPCWATRASSWARAGSASPPCRTGRTGCGWTWFSPRAKAR